MKLTFKEACSALADLYEAIPETYCVGDFYQDEYGLQLNDADDLSGAMSFCAVGGVSMALNVPREEARKKLIDVSSEWPDAWLRGSPATISNSGRENAIKLLRMASGEL